MSSHIHSNTSHASQNQHRSDGNGHTHGATDPTLLTNQRGIWAVRWSLIGLSAVAIFQIVIVFFSGSVALLADTIHNVGDATTAIPLWIAFTLARRKPSRRFSYGYGRVEDLAGVAIVMTILFSAIVSGYEAVNRLLHPQFVGHLAAVMLASFVGFVGNEIVAIFRIRVGKQIDSAALIADGYHARVDGITSLGVLLSTIGIGLGYPLADPLMGLLITIAILRIVWDSVKSVFARLLDGVEPQVIDEIKHAVQHVPGVRGVTDVRVRWLGHRLHAEVNLAVKAETSVAEAHAIAVESRHQLLHHLPQLSNATIHIDPDNILGEEYHRISNHMHGDLPVHSHH